MKLWMLKVFLIIYASYFFLITKKNKPKIMEDIARFEPAMHAKRCIIEPLKPPEKRDLKILFISIHIYAQSRMNSLIAILTVTVRIYSEYLIRSRD